MADVSDETNQAEMSESANTPTIVDEVSTKQMEKEPSVMKESDERGRTR